MATRQIEKAQGQVDAATAQLGEVRRQTALISAQSAGIRAVELRKMLDAAKEAAELADRLRSNWEEFRERWFDVGQALSPFRAGGDQPSPPLEEAYQRAAISSIEAALPIVRTSSSLASTLRTEINRFAWIGDEIYSHVEPYDQALSMHHSMCNSAIRTADALIEFLREDSTPNGFANALLGLLSRRYLNEFDIKLSELSSSIQSHRELLQIELREALTDTIRPPRNG